jgi:hypothetical protein
VLTLPGDPFQTIRDIFTCLTLGRWPFRGEVQVSESRNNSSDQLCRW